ncbi:MAG: hypothetical protein WC444_02985 [Candidatus Paceibacterota bacterium]
MKITHIFLTVLFLTTPFVASASSVDGTIDINPTSPAPYSSVTLTLSSYSFNVSTAMITWYSGTKQILSGFGKKEITVRTGASGEVLPLRAKAVTANGTTLEASVSLVPESVSLLYESSEGYVPPFYEGRSLGSEGSTARVSAIPAMSENGKKVPADLISYTWYANDELLESLSGAGKQSVPIPLEYVRDSTTVKVIATAPYGTKAENTIEIYPHKVMPLLYTYDAVLGTDFTNLITRRFETTKDFTLSLVPFFLSSRGSLGSTVSYDWSLDGMPITPIGGTLLSLSPKKDSYGSRPLSISVDNSVRRLQKAQVDIDLVFDTRKQ